MPSGNYLIENDTVQSKIIFVDTISSDKTLKTTVLGIIILENIIVIFSDCKFTLKPNNKNRQSVLTFSNYNNSTVIGGSIYGDRYCYFFEFIINNDENSLEFGTIDSNVNYLNDSNYMITKNFISNCDNSNSLPNKFAICPLQNNTYNTVYGGKRNIYCYNSTEKYLGKATTSSDSFINDITLLPSTAKIKVDFKYEKNYNAKFYITTDLTYKTFEQSQGITIYPSDNFEINELLIEIFLSDGICRSKTDADNAYYRIYNNYIEGYTASGGVYGNYLKLSFMKGTTFKNCIVDIRASFSNNIYYDYSIVTRKNSLITDEQLRKSFIN